MRTPFLGGAYTTRSPVLSSNTCVNLYAELVPDKSGKIGGFNGTPGLGTVFQDIAGEVRGLWVTSGPASGGYKLFAVIANKVYRLDESYSGVAMTGTLPNSTGPVSICDNGSEILFAHQDGMHFCNVSDSAITPVLNAISGAIVTGMDNYIVFTDNNYGQFGVSNVDGDLSSIDPLSTASAEGWPDDTVSVLADHREVWLFGTETIEIWDDVGAAFFPFQRVSGGFIEQGCLAPRSPVKLDNSVFWLGADRNGKGVVYRSNVYMPQRISTHAIEFALNQGTITDAIGFGYQDEGHAYYVLTLPSLDQTWVYDCATQLWHRRGYLDRTGTLRRHRANCHAYFNGDQIVGDQSNGKIYRMSLDYATDDGDPIYRERAWSLAENELDIENKKTRIDVLELHCLTGEVEDISFNTIQGSGAWDDDWARAWGIDWGLPANVTTETERKNQVWLEVSLDSGRTWTYKRFQNLGPLGQRKQRLRWRRLGSKRNINLRIATDMQVPVSFVGAYINAEVLSQ